MSVPPLAPFRLKPFFSPRPWGRRSLKPWYSPSQVGTTEPIGEAWLTGPQCIAETSSLTGQPLASIAASHPTQLLGAHTQPPAEFPLLIKLLFPADKLSVQVHPDDTHAQAMGQPRGKTECWYVLSSEPGAQIALGFNPAVTPEQLTPESVRAAIAAGTLEDLMHWLPVAPGDMFFVDAGTVHAIGPGMVLLETQQTSDITFRMYDYGRPRELHVDSALRVMKTHTAAGKVAPITMQGAPPTRSLGGSQTPHEFTRLIQQQYFTVDRYDLAAGASIAIPSGSAGCLVPLSGNGTVSVADSAAQNAAASSINLVDLIPGHAIVLPAATGEITVAATTAASFIHSWAP